MDMAIRRWLTMGPKSGPYRTHPDRDSAWPATALLQARLIAIPNHGNAAAPQVERTWRRRITH